MTPEEQIKELRDKINYHSDRYYNQDSPEISDYEFDMLMQQLKKLEKEHPELVTKDSPTQHVGGTAKRTAGVLVHHNVPMLSLQDVFSKEEVVDFVEQMKEQLDDPEFVVEYKIDGLSMALRYENGDLSLALTRGDGVNFGEDVTANAKVISDVKKKLKDKPEYLEIRGEVYMKNEDFDRVNEQQELLGKKIFANPRNCAAGTLRQLDSRVTKERKLSMFVFNIQQVRGMDIMTHTQGYEFLKRLASRSSKITKYAKRRMKSGMQLQRSEKTVEISATISMVRSLRSTAIRTGNCSEIHQKFQNGQSHTNIRRKKRKQNCLILNFPLEGPEGSHRLPCLSRCACVERLFQGQHCTIRISLMI